jgi:hypothetical protein
MKICFNHIEIIYSNVIRMIRVLFVSSQMSLDFKITIGSKSKNDPLKFNGDHYKSHIIFEIT